MPHIIKGVKRPKLSQELEKRLISAAKAVQKGMALHTALKNVDVSHSVLRSVVHCDGIYKFVCNFAMNQAFSEEAEKELLKYLQTA
jgi:hypothetical protein